MTVAPEELLDVAVAAARAGGAVLVEGLTRPKKVEQKSERASIVTWADVTAQAEIFAVIRAAYPEHTLLGEEGEGGGTDAGHVWLVDPLDGTSNYAAGIPFACSSVAVRDEAGVAAGAIFEPFREELFAAARGRGAWVDDGRGEVRRLAVSDTRSIERALVCTGLQTDVPSEIDAFARRIVALHRGTRGHRALGSPALCLAYVAAGRIDAFLERDATYAWDVAAGSLMIAEAGGRCEDLDGGVLNLGPGLANVLATNGTLHDDLFALVATAEAAQT